MEGLAANRWWWPFPATSAALLDAGQHAVAVVVAVLNRVAGPVLDACLDLRSSGAGRAW